MCRCLYLQSVRVSLFSEGKLILFICDGAFFCLRSWQTLDHCDRYWSQTSHNWINPPVLSRTRLNIKLSSLCNAVVLSYVSKLVNQFSGIHTEPKLNQQFTAYSLCWLSADTSLTQPRVLLHHSVFFMVSSHPSFTQKPGLSGSIMTGCFKQNSKWWCQKPLTSQSKCFIMFGVIHRSTCSAYVSADVTAIKAKTVAVFFFFFFIFYFFFFSKKITRSRHKHHLFSSFFCYQKIFNKPRNNIFSSVQKVRSWFLLVRPLPPTSCFLTSWESWAH